MYAKTVVEFLVILFFFGLVLPGVHVQHLLPDLADASVEANQLFLLPMLIATIFFGQSVGMSTSTGMIS